MRTSQTFRTHFTIRSDKAKNGMAPLYVAVTVNKEKIFISLKESVHLNDWNFGKGSAKGSRPEIKKLNAYLEEVRLSLGNCYRELQLKGKLITPQSIKSAFLGEGDLSLTLRTLINYHNDTAGKALDPATLRQYGVTQRYLIRFVNAHFKADDIALKEIDFGFIQSFDAYLRNYHPLDHHKPLKDNGIKVHLKRFKKMVRLAQNLEWIERDPFATFRIKLKRVAREFLTEGELQAIESKRFDIERLELIQDLFIFSCYTGLSYGDLMALRPQQIVLAEDGERWIRTFREKTEEPVNLPLLPKAVDIIDKYRGNARAAYIGKVFPLLSNQKINSYLKEIANFCGVHKNLTFHMARHTFATTVTLSNGVPIETVSKILGHTKVSTTQIYARVVEKKLQADMRSLKDKLSLKELQNK